MNRGFFLLFVVTLFGCQKVNDKPCDSFPCDEKEAWYASNRVAFEPGFRIGKWVNVRENVGVIDTVVFHSDTIWSNYNLNSGIYNGKYKFDNTILRIFEDYNGNIIPSGYPFETYYNDTTGILTVQKQSNFDHYIKIN